MAPADTAQALVQRYLSPPSKIVGYSVHPGASRSLSCVRSSPHLTSRPLPQAPSQLMSPLSSLPLSIEVSPDRLPPRSSLTPSPSPQLRQTRQYKEAYGNAIGALVETAVRPIMRAADEGCVRALSLSGSLPLVGD